MIITNAKSAEQYTIWWWGLTKVVVKMDDPLYKVGLYETIMFINSRPTFDD